MLDVYYLTQDAGRIDFRRMVVVVVVALAAIAAAFQNLSKCGEASFWPFQAGGLRQPHVVNFQYEESTVPEVHARRLRPIPDNQRKRNLNPRSLRWRPLQQYGQSR